MTRGNRILRGVRAIPAVGGSKGGRVGRRIAQRIRMRAPRRRQHARSFGPIARAERALGWLDPQVCVALVAQGRRRRGTVRCPVRRTDPEQCRIGPAERLLRHALAAAEGGHSAAGTAASAGRSVSPGRLAGFRARVAAALRPGAGIAAVLRIRTGVGRTGVWLKPDFARPTATDVSQIRDIVAATRHDGRPEQRANRDPHQRLHAPGTRLHRHPSLVRGARPGRAPRSAPGSTA